MGSWLDLSLQDQDPKLPGQYSAGQDKTWVSNGRHLKSTARKELSCHLGARALPSGSVMLHSHKKVLWTKVMAVILLPPNLRHPATAEYFWEMGKGKMG